MKAPTHNEKVLALLSDGKPHSHREIYGLFVVGHSRIADLRKRGHTIEMWREDDAYWYRLLLSDGQGFVPSALPIAEKVLPGGTTRSSPPLRRGSVSEPDAVDAHPLASSGQLSLSVAA